MANHQSGKENTHCTTAALMLTQVRTLKATFDSSFEVASTSGNAEDVLQAQTDKAQLLSAMALLQNNLDSLAYEQRESDTEFLTRIKQKLTEGRLLSHTDLSFLYEVPKPFEGSGEDKQSLREIRKERNPEEDMLIIFACNEDQIAHSIEEITASTKAYVGELQPNIFTLLPEGIEYVYTSFPEGRIHCEHFGVGGMAVAQLKAAMKQAKFQVDDGGLMESQEFKESIHEPPEYTKLKSLEQMNFVRLSVGDLGFPNGATIQEIFAKAIALGLELCPPEVGPYYRLHYANQPMNEYVYIGMNQIIDRPGRSDVFRVHCDHSGAWLRRAWAEPAREWDADDQFVFRIRKLES
ncbi:MAG: hypothetical protein AAB448_03420 [Patescibacteria group bacterium]